MIFKRKWRWVIIQDYSAYPVNNREQRFLRIRGMFLRMLPTFINSVEIDLTTKIEYIYTKKAIILHKNDRLFIFYTRYCLG